MRLDTTHCVRVELRGEFTVSKSHSRMPLRLSLLLYAPAYAKPSKPVPRD
jgi:hypothetical protein